MKRMQKTELSREVAQSVVTVGAGSWTCMFSFTWKPQGFCVKFSKGPSECLYRGPFLQRLSLKRRESVASKVPEKRLLDGSWISKGTAKPSNTVGMVLWKITKQRLPLHIRLAPFPVWPVACIPDAWQNPTGPKGWSNVIYPLSLLVFEDELSLRKEGVISPSLAHGMKGTFI